MLLTYYAFALLSCRVALTAATYPLYGAKSRYSRSMAWPPLPIYYAPRATRPLYYPDTTISDYYYPQDPYYYPVEKYPVYQSVVPGFYIDQQRPYYYGYDEVSDPVDDMQDDVVEDENRSEMFPYGQETWYQDSDRSTENNADVNARFLQNLILAQMYSDASKYPPSEEEEDQGAGRWVYGEPVKTSKQKTMNKEDEDVRELKSLARMDRPTTERMERSDKKSRKTKEDLFTLQKSTSNDWDKYSSRSSGYKRSNEIKFSSRKTKLASTTPAPEATSQPLRGQKEVVLPRPANPARTPDFHKFNARSSVREPSVYDTIKKLLHMEEQLDQNEAGSRVQKRSYIPSEESLVAQLGGLKKMA